MKSAFVLAALVGLLCPTAALADPNDCARLLSQIYQYEDMVERAEARDREDWADKMQNHVDLLEDRLATRCPASSARDEEQETKRQLAILMKAAANAAVKFFTLGAL